MTLHSEKSRYLSTALCCCLMAGASMGLCFYSAGVFAEPVSQGLGISLGSATLMQTIVLASMAVMTLFLPMAIKKLPYQKILLYSGIVCVAATLGLSFSFNTAFLYIFSALQGLSAACFGFLPVSIILNNWFYERNGWVLSLALAFAPLSAACFVLMYGVCVQALGWRMTYVIQAVCIAVFLAPALLLPLVSSPVKLGLQPYGDPTPVVRSERGNAKGKVIFILIIAIMGAVLMALPQHFSSLSISLGQPALLGATMFSYCMLGSIIFKLIGGMMADRIGPFYAIGILGVFTLIGTIGLMICSFVPNETALKVLSFFFGSSYGLAELSLPLLVRSEFPKGRFSTIYGLANAVSMLVTAISIGLIGFIYDQSLTYRWIILADLIINVCIVFLVGYVYYRQSDKLIHHISERMAERKAKKEAKAREEARKAHPSQPVHLYSTEELEKPMEEDVPEKPAAENTEAVKPEAEASADVTPETDDVKSEPSAADKTETADQPEASKAEPAKETPAASSKTDASSKSDDSSAK